MHIINTSKPYFSSTQEKEFFEKVSLIIKSQRLILGEYTKQLEEKFSTMYNSKGAVLVNSATSSLILLFKYLNSTSGNVIMPSLNFISVANAVQFAGGGIKFCDVVKDKLFPSLDEIIEAEDSKTTGIVLVDIAGERNPYIADIVQYANDKGYFVILDSSHSHGLVHEQNEFYNKIDAQVFSMYPTKILTSATGGVVLSNHGSLINYLKSARHHGLNKSLEDCDTLGGGFYSSEFDAALGVVMFNALSDITNERKIIASNYDVAVSEIDGIKSLVISNSAYYKYQIVCSSSSLCKVIKSYMHDKGIMTGAVYNPPIHQQPLYHDREKYDLRNTEDITPRIIALPMYNGMDKNDLNKVIKAIYGIQSI